MYNFATVESQLTDLSAALAAATADSDSCPAPGGDPASGDPVAVLSCLLSALQSLHAAPDLERGLASIAEAVRRLVPHDTFGILLLDERGRELRYAHAVGFAPEISKHWRFGMGQGLVGTVAQTRQSIVVGDVSTDSRYIDAGGGVRSEAAIPLLSRGRTVGVLDVGSREIDFFTATHLRYLTMLGGHLASAIESAQLQHRSREQARTLSLLHEMSREFSSILDRRRLLEVVAERVHRLIPYDLFGVLLWNEDKQLLEPWLHILADGRRIDPPRPVGLGQGLCGTAAALRQPVRVPNVHLDPRYLRCVLDPETSSELVVPLLFKDRLLGVIDLESVAYDAFSSADEQLLSTLAASLATALENARLYEVVRGDEQRIRAELRTAHEIQHQLLPKATPWVPGLQIGLAYEPARDLGGDFYDLLPYGQGRLAIAVGDVSGKATAAALYGSFAVGTLRQIADRGHPGPAEVLLEMNCKLHELGISNRFLAMAFATFDEPSRTVTLANSGLPRPWLVRAGKASALDIGGVPLGMLAGREYREISFPLGPGDALVLCTDGVEESFDAADQEFGAERIRVELERLSAAPAAEIAEGLRDAARRFSGRSEPSDDRTIVVLKAT